MQLGFVLCGALSLYAVYRTVLLVPRMICGLISLFGTLLSRLSASLMNAAGFFWWIGRCVFPQRDYQEIVPDDAEIVASVVGINLDDAGLKCSIRLSDGKMMRLDMGNFGHHVLALTRAGCDTRDESIIPNSVFCTPLHPPKHQVNIFAIDVENDTKRYIAQGFRYKDYLVTASHVLVDGLRYQMQGPSGSRTFDYRDNNFPASGQVPA